MTTIRVIPVPIRELKLEKMTGTIFVLIPIIRRKNEFEPQPQNKILVPFRGCFKTFYMGFPWDLLNSRIQSLLNTNHFMSPDNTNTLTTS